MTSQSDRIADGNHGGDVALGGTGVGALGGTGVGVLAPTRTTRAELYYQAKADGTCTRNGCSRPAVDGAQFCTRHLRKKRAADRAWRAERRQAERDAGRCAEGCGRKSPTYRCAVCAIRLRRIPTLGVGTGVVTPPSTAADQDQWRRDAEGYERYRGRGRRGKPPAAITDEADIVEALDALERAREGLAYARSPEVLAMPRIQRRDATLAALAYLDLAERFMDEIRERNGHGK